MYVCMYVLIYIHMRARTYTMQVKDGRMDVNMTCIITTHTYIHTHTHTYIMQVKDGRFGAMMDVNM